MSAMTRVLDTGSRAAGLLALCGAALLQAACAAEPGPQVSDSDHASGPTTEAIQMIHLHDVPLSSADEMIESSTVIAVARLLEIRPIDQLTYDGEDVRGRGNELVELVFAPRTLLKGAPTKTISIRWAGYSVDSEGRRQARLRLNGVGFADEDIGSSFLLFARAGAEGMVLNSLDGALRIRADGGLEPLVTDQAPGASSSNASSAGSTDRPSAEIGGLTVQDLQRKIERLASGPK